MTTEEFRERLRLACAAAGSQRAFAERHGISAVYVGQVLDGSRVAGPLVLAALGCRRRVVIEVAPAGEVADGCD